MLILLLACLVSQVVSWSNILFVVLGQNSKYDREWSDALGDSITWQSIKLFEQKNQDLDFYETVKTPLFYQINGSEALCYWQILTLSKRLIDDPAQVDKDWFVFLDGYSDIRLEKLHKFLESQDSSVPAYFGHAIHDKRMTVTHHYYGFRNDDDPPFHYPDVSAGIVISRPLLQKIKDIASKEMKPFPQFTIDASHELARFVFDKFNIRLTNRNEEFCLEDNEQTCAIYYIEPRYECREKKRATPDDVKVYVKTWSANHETRLRVVMATWGASFRSIEYISDVDSDDPPTRSLGVPNTNRGHCAKTYAILDKFVNEASNDDFRWLLIADDDTLINVDALMGPLSCYDHEDVLIIGERYGFGASLTGKGAYNYPTGGAGMIFSRKAAQRLVRTCTCPRNESPDDMVIGMCSMAEDIPIIHSPAFHQAQPFDYPEPYLKKIRPISFHKFTEISPVAVFHEHVDVKPSPRPENYAEPSERRRRLGWSSFRSAVRSPADKIQSEHHEL